MKRCGDYTGKQGRYVNPAERAAAGLTGYDFWSGVRERERTL
jgi:hypothetical protein